MAAVDENEELYALWASVVKERVQRGADGASGVEDVVHEDDVAAVDVEAEVARFDDRTDVAGSEIVAIKTDVEDAGFDGLFLDGLDHACDALRERDAAAFNPDQA